MDIKTFKEILDNKKKTGHAHICPQCCCAFINGASFLNQGPNCRVCNYQMDDSLIVPVLECENIPDDEEFTVLENGNDIQEAKRDWPDRKKVPWVVRQQIKVVAAMRKCQKEYQNKILKPFRDPM